MLGVFNLCQRSGHYRSFDGAAAQDQNRNLPKGGNDLSVLMSKGHRLLDHGD